MSPFPLRARLVPAPPFGARLAKSMLAVIAAVLLAAELGGDPRAGIFAGLTAFAAVSPNLRLSWIGAGRILLANLVGAACALAAVLPPFLPGFAWQAPVAITLSLALGHRFLPRNENQALVATLVLLSHPSGVTEVEALAERLAVVLIGSASGLAINALWPPRHLRSAALSLEAARAGLAVYAGEILQSLEWPEAYAKERNKEDQRRIQAEIDRAVERLSYVSRRDPARVPLRWAAQTLQIALDSLAELHRFALYEGGLDAGARQRVARAVDWVLASLEGRLREAEAGPGAQPYSGPGPEPALRPELYPLRHLILRLKEGPPAGSGG